MCWLRQKNFKQLTESLLRPDFCSNMCAYIYTVILLTLHCSVLPLLIYVVVSLSDPRGSHLRATSPSRPTNRDDSHSLFQFLLMVQANKCLKFKAINTLLKQAPRDFPGNQWLHFFFIYKRSSYKEQRGLELHGHRSSGDKVRLGFSLLKV